MSDASTVHAPLWYPPSHVGFDGFGIAVFGLTHGDSKVISAGLPPAGGGVSVSGCPSGREIARQLGRSCGSLGPTNSGMRDAMNASFAGTAVPVTAGLR